MHGHLTIPLDIIYSIKEPSTLRFLIWCVMQAVKTETEVTARGQAVALVPGQFIFNRRKAAAELEDYGLTERKIRTALSRCIASQKASQKTSQKITVITVANFLSYEIGASRTVPISVPISVPKTTYKTCDNKSPSIISNTRSKRNTSNKKNMNNKEKHPLLRESVEQVFAHYRKTFPTFGRTVKPGHKDWALIGDRISDGYSVEECIEAVNGNHIDAWYQEKGLHSLRYIFRDAAIMDKFIKNWQTRGGPVVSEKGRRGFQAGQAWAAMEETHGQ